MRFNGRPTDGGSSHTETHSVPSGPMTPLDTSLTVLHPRKHRKRKEGETKERGMWRVWLGGSSSAYLVYYRLKFLR